jgi:hypothetical protein
LGYGFSFSFFCTIVPRDSKKKKKMWCCLIVQDATFIRTDSKFQIPCCLTNDRPLPLRNHLSCEKWDAFLLRGNRSSELLNYYSFVHSVPGCSAGTLRIPSNLLKFRYWRQSA